MVAGRMMEDGGRGTDFGGQKLIVIVGPTASGKSALAMELAEKYGGEIIAADSRTVYRYTNIGTAKSTQADMLRIPHHLIDVVNPGDLFTAADFKNRAVAAIDDISGRGGLPIMVGGTGLYIDSVLFDYRFPERNPEARAMNADRSLAELVEELKERDPQTADMIDLNNRRRVERALETISGPKSKSQTLRPQTLVLGMAVNKKMLQKRIEARLEKMLKEGLIDEIKTLGNKFGWESEALTGTAYRAFKDVGLGDKSIADAKAEDVKQELNLAKRQMTWFKRNPHISWVESWDEAEKLVDAWI